MIQQIRFTGYVADASIAPSNKLAPPSVNCIVNENGEVEQRLGYEETTIDLNVAGSPARSFYMEQWDITVFTIGTKVKYYDWTTEEVIDTGLTLTDGTISRGEGYAGDLYITNTTDGMRRLVFGRLNDSAADSGDGTVIVDYDFAARLDRFGITTGSLLIGGDSYAYNAVDVATGVITLNAVTLSQDYDDNTIILRLHDISSGREKFSKLGFWKERMVGIGSVVATNADQPNASEYFGKFASYATLENIIDFTFGVGGATIELVGKWGRVTNFLATKDYLYTFKESESYVAAAADVVITGSGIGMTTPDLRDENHGCLNEDCAAGTGNSEVTYVTPNRRILRIRIATESGAPVQFPDESFDVPMREHLKNLDDDQSLALVYHYKGKRWTIYQLSVSGQYIWFIYDHAINAWQPPQNVLCASSFFERKGVLYAADASDDTIYSLFTSFADNGNSFDVAAFSGDFDVRDATVRQVHASGLISQPSIIRLQSHVTNQRGGRQSGSEKLISGSDYTYSRDFSVGALPVGSGGVESETMQVASWKKSFDVFPSEANRVQISISQSEESGYFRLSQLSLEITPTVHSQSSL